MLPKTTGKPAKAAKEAAPNTPAANAEEKKKEEKKEKAAKEEAKPAEAPAKPAAAFIYIARELPNGDFIYQRPDIACRDGQGANSVGSTVCDVIKEAVDVKPWPRNTYGADGPAHAPQYYHGNEGDIPSNADGTLKSFISRRVDPSTYEPVATWGSYAQEQPDKV